MNLTPYQWSIKLDNGEIFVIQTETEDELFTKKETMLARIMNVDSTKAQETITTALPVTPQSPTATPSQEQPSIPEIAEDWCEIHKTKMKQREGKFGVFYSHAKEVEGQWMYCSGLGFK